jgi:hypothetical protein
LTVPAKFITFVNPPPCDTSDTDTESDSDSDYGDEERFEFADIVAFGGTVSRPETPVPTTPLTVDDQRESIFADEPIHDEGREFASFLGDSTLSQTDEGSPVFSCDQMSQMDYEVLDDDEEDDLPPFDDWYTSVQARMPTS